MRTPGTKDAPIPWMPWGRKRPPESTGERAGSTPTIRTPGTRSFSTSPTPVIVPPGADGGDEGVQVPLRRLEDLDGRRAPVHLRVGLVLELHWHEVVRVLPAHLLGGEHRPRHALDGRRQMDLGAIAGEQALPLHAHVVGHGQDEAIAANGAHHREAHPGIAARGLDQRRPGLQDPPQLRILDHRERDAVLDAAGGIERLHFAEHGGAVGVWNSVELHEGCATDQLED